MAIQHRHGEFKDFDPNKMVTAELAVVTSGDPASPTGRTLYICFAPGVVKRIVSYEDFENELQNATEEIQQAFTEEIRRAIARVAEAINAANDATKKALKAAEVAGAYVLGDISNKTVDFSETERRETINSGESTATLFGKIKRWFQDLKGAAFCNVTNDFTVLSAGTVADGRTVQRLKKELDKFDENMKNETLVPRFESLYLANDVRLYSSQAGFTVSISVNGVSHKFAVKESGVFFDGKKLIQNQ